jgi:glutamate-1-semialdehyde 2,1-aminomutase
MGVTGDGRYSAPYPTIFESAQGKYLRDVDGNTYLDYHGGFGTAILGYAHPEVDSAVHKATQEWGAFVGLPNPYEEELAERLCGLIPFAERIALCGGGGSDAVYHAVRLSRAATGRTKILKMEGGYHGWHADVGVSTRPSLATPDYVGLPVGVANSAGSLPAVTSEVLVATANDADALRQVFAARGSEIAALLIEPVIYSMGCVQVDVDYLRLARDLCTRNGSVLIFDEIMTGFRCGLGGAGAALGTEADLGCFGKAVANGYVLAAVAGRAELMKLLAPEGPVFYQGTFNGHPLSVAAALATLDVLEREDVPARIGRLGDRLARGINRAIAELEVSAVCQSFGSVWNLYFNTSRICNYRDLVKSDSPRTVALNDRYHRHLREQGIYVHRRHVNRGFVSAAHDDGDIDRTVSVVAEFLATNRAELAR